MRKGEAILRERQSVMLSAQLTEIEEQEHRSTLLSSWLDTFYTYWERREVYDLHCITAIKLLGHTNVKTTQIYAKIVNKKKDDAVSLVDNIFD